MDIPVSESEPVKESKQSFQCGLSDGEVVHKIAYVLLEGLATACIDNTTGDIFRSPTSVAVDVRKEMVEYLTQRTETLVADLMVQEGEQVVESTNDHPTEIITDIADDFAATKRNLLGRVSGWLLSESREDKIDDFVQEMEMKGFWLMDRRKTVAEDLLKNVDFKNEYHCSMKFDTIEQLEDHKSRCDFRPLSCTNEGCKVNFCAAHMDKHDSVCPFKIIHCEQDCDANVMRREMDRHCITVCPMKLVNCPFNQVGCQTTVPLCNVEQHCLEFLHFHVLHVLQVIYKKKNITDEMKELAILLEKSQSSNELSEALDIRSLTMAIKKLESKIKKPKDGYSDASPRTPSLEGN